MDNKRELTDDGIDAHFDYYLRDLGNDSKKRLINKLVESIINPLPELDSEPRGTLEETLEVDGPWEGPFPPEWEKYFKDDEEEVISNVVSEPQVKYKRPDDEEK